MKKLVSIKSKFEIERCTHLLTLDVTLEQLKLITQNQYSHNSLLAMRKDWLIFTDYVKSKQRRALPASSGTVKEFISSMTSKRKYSTLKRYAITISNIHRILSYDDPTTAPEIVYLLNQIRLNKNGDERQTTAFSYEHLQSIRNILLNETDPVSSRDLAIYSIMFECALKRSDLRDLTFQQLLPQKRENKSYFVISISDYQYELSQETSCALEAWISILGHAEGPVFRSIDRHQNISSNAMNDSSIYRILKKASTLLELPEHLSFSGQSARVGAVTELYKQGLNIRDIQEFGRWNSPVMPNQYLGNLNLAEQGKLIFKSFNKKV